VKVSWRGSLLEDEFGWLDEWQAGECPM